MKMKTTASSLRESLSGVSSSVRFKEGGRKEATRRGPGAGLTETRRENILLLRSLTDRQRITPTKLAVAFVAGSPHRRVLMVFGAEEKGMVVRGGRVGPRAVERG